MATDSKTSAIAAPPPPPRLQGVTSDPNIPVIFNWAWDFYNAVVTNNYYVSQANQFSAGDFDATKLTQPANATIASAQSTANEAYVLAAKANGRTEGFFRGQITISGASNAGLYTFADQQKDTEYAVMIQAVGYTGTPTIDAFHVIKVTKAVDKFEFNINQPPGTGASVTFDFVLIRGISK